jgi:hypothetical protein
MSTLPPEAKRVRIYAIAEICIIIGFACVPLFSSFPYRVNIFLSWEGAYRMSQGQIPFKDFGLPMGYMFWIVPALFFKIFGPQLITLVKAQVLINIVSGFSFRSILKSLNTDPGIRLLSVLLYVISFSFFNFWPWYNHTVIVYEMAGLAFLFRFLCPRGERSWVWLPVSALFIFFSFFTKQDGGGMAFLLSCALLVTDGLLQKKWSPLLIFIISFVVIGALIIYPLTRYNFGYWFNHGQPPHTARISVMDILDEFFAGSQWIKFYLFLIGLLVVSFYKKWKQLIAEKRYCLFLVLTLGILAEASIIQVTSYTPPDNNIFYHSFAFAFILSTLAACLRINFYSLRYLFVGLAGVLLWWSGTFWKYIQRLAVRMLPAQEARVSATGENIVNRRTYKINLDSTDIPESQWVFSGLRSFKHIYMPKPTAEGIRRLLNSPLVKEHKDLKVLNMSELTPLAVEIPYKPETGPDIPLWYHLGVGMFNKQAEAYERKIADRYYDLILFEYIPSLNNFYPFRIHENLPLYYHRIDSFPAPRHGDTYGVIEVFSRQ